MEDGKLRCPACGSALTAGRLGLVCQVCGFDSALSDRQPHSARAARLADSGTGAAAERPAPAGIGVTLRVLAGEFMGLDGLTKEKYCFLWLYAIGAFVTALIAALGFISILDETASISDRLYFMVFNPSTAAALAGFFVLRAALLGQNAVFKGLVIVCASLIICLWIWQLAVVIHSANSYTAASDMPGQLMLAAGCIFCIGCMSWFISIMWRDIQYSSY